MRLFLTMLGLILIFSACKNEAEKVVPDQEIFLEEDSEAEYHPNKAKQNNASPMQKDSSGLNSPREEPISEDTSTKSMAGNYMKVGQEKDSDCTCYCLEVYFNATSEICLTPEKMYIQVRFERIDENLVHVFLLDPSDSNTEGDEIPWNDFDRDTPVATLSSPNTGEVDFDWLGFKINGDLAQDYALFGKKTLEGSYKKK